MTPQILVLPFLGFAACPSTGNRCEVFRTPQRAGAIISLQKQGRFSAKSEIFPEVADDESALATLDINQSDIQRVLADFDEAWDALPPREQVHVVSLLVETVNFDGPGGNVAITFHPTGLKTLFHFLGVSSQPLRRDCDQAG